MWDIVQNYPPGQLLAFISAGLALNFAPGADVLFATASGLRGGPRAGMMAGLGVGLGGVLHVSLAAMGISALIAAHPGALVAVRWIGAGYLLWLALSAWRDGPPGAASSGAADPIKALSRGFLANAFNPKVILFILAFLPQFTVPAIGPVWMQIILLGGIFTVTGTLVTMGYGALAGAMQKAIAKKLGLMNRISAVILGGLAARLLME